jgi:hypothetical protein
MDSYPDSTYTDGKTATVCGCLIVIGTGVPGERRVSQVEHRPSLAAFNLDLDQLAFI